MSYINVYYLHINIAHFIQHLGVIQRKNILTFNLVNK